MNTLTDDMRGALRRCYQAMFRRFIFTWLIGMLLFAFLWLRFL